MKSPVCICLQYENLLPSGRREQSYAIVLAHVAKKHSTSNSFFSLVEPAVR